jgi:hypothetical protein
MNGGFCLQTWTGGASSARHHGPACNLVRGHFHPSSSSHPWPASQCMTLPTMTDISILSSILKASKGSHNTAHVNFRIKKYSNLGQPLFEAIVPL